MSTILQRCIRYTTAPEFCLCTQSHGFRNGKFITPTLRGRPATSVGFLQQNAISAPTGPVLDPHALKFTTDPPTFNNAQPISPAPYFLAPTPFASPQLSLRLRPLLAFDTSIANPNTFFSASDFDQIDFLSTENQRSINCSRRGTTLGQKSTTAGVRSKVSSRAGRRIPSNKGAQSQK